MTSIDPKEAKSYPEGDTKRMKAKRKQRKENVFS
jgi:hypothetical protein